MKKIFPKVFEVKITVASFIGLFVVAFLVCAGINGCMKFIDLPNVIETVLIVLCTLYFGVLVFLAFLNLIGVIKVKE